MRGKNGKRKKHVEKIYTNDERREGRSKEDK